MASSICKRWGLVCPFHLWKGLFTVGALDNIDHNLSSTTAQGSFCGTGISVFNSLLETILVSIVILLCILMVIPMIISTRKLYQHSSCHQQNQWTIALPQVRCTEIQGHLGKAKTRIKVDWTCYKRSHKASRDLIKCSCKAELLCSRRCECQGAGFPCTALCQCGGMYNQ